MIYYYCLQEALKTEQVRLQAALAEEERHAGTSQESGGEQPDRQAGGEDELDAFMGQVAVQLEQDKVNSLADLQAVLAHSVGPSHGATGSSHLAYCVCTCCWAISCANKGRSPCKLYLHTLLGHLSSQQE